MKSFIGPIVAGENAAGAMSMGGIYIGGPPTQGWMSTVHRVKRVHESAVRRRFEWGESAVRRTLQKCASAVRRGIERGERSWKLTITSSWNRRSADEYCLSYASADDGGHNRRSLQDIGCQPMSAEGARRLVKYSPPSHLTSNDLRMRCNVSSMLSIRCTN
jgi:hypothetical protein